MAYVTIKTTERGHALAKDLSKAHGLPLAKVVENALELYDAMMTSYEPGYVTAQALSALVRQADESPDTHDAAQALLARLLRA